jgi:ribonuclease D
MFAYRARVCVAQLAFRGEVAIVDALSASLAPLAPVLRAKAPLKIIHDVAFDARLLAEAGLELDGVHDTALAARMLGRASTGLAAVLKAELGLEVEKTMQHHDWRIRPLTEDMIRYLAADAAHLERLDDVLFARAREAGIEEEIAEETRHRIEVASRAVRDLEERPPYLRLKGIQRVPPAERAIAKELAAVRERAAAERDVPPHKIMSAEALLAIARSRPAAAGQLRKLRVPQGLVDDVLRAVAKGLEAGDVPEGERAILSPPRPPAEEQKARRAREGRLTAWRKTEAARRKVDEQVVLPGHCLRDIAELDALEAPSDLARVPGIGAFRVARDGDALARAWRGDAGNAS